MTTPIVAGVDVFCGAGGLTYGLERAGVRVLAGVDIDPACRFPYEQNNSAKFLLKDVKAISGRDLLALYPKGTVRLLAGCAPCRPFSSFSRGEGRDQHRDWGLLEEFARLVGEVSPELVTMENVPDLAKQPPFSRLLGVLESLGFDCDYRSVYCPTVGIPQHRRRLVLVASRIGAIIAPKGTVDRGAFRTVRDAIGGLPVVAAGCSDARDRLHKARSLSARNLERLRASRPGGTWEDWDESLRTACHKRPSGASYRSVYARMAWDEPSPTITTQAYNFGTGRFGHPEQDRSITLREAAILQTFPRKYRFVDRSTPVRFNSVGRLIGNAVPPALGKAIGRELVRVARNAAVTGTWKAK